MSSYNPFARLSWLLTGMADLGPLAGAIVLYLAVAAVVLL